MAIRQRSARIAKFYSRIGSHGWRGTEYFTYSVRSPMLRRWIASQLPKRTARILSVGCGTGEVESHLAELGHCVVGLDVSGEMLKRARASGLELLAQADSQSLPFGAGSFAVVMLLESIGYLDLETAFKEAGRVLRRNGRLLLTTYSGKVAAHGSYRKFGLDEIASALAAGGFRVKEHRFLAAKRNAVAEAPSAGASALLYVLAAKEG